MPRVGNVYAAPAGTTAFPNTTIESAKYNALVADLVGDANAARPETAGGTGKTALFAGANTWTGVQTLTTPQINDTSADHQYVVAVNELAADRTVTLPLLAANDEFVFLAHHAASQTDQEAGATNSKFVTPGRQHSHPSAAKAWVNSASTGSLDASYNVASVADNGTGNWTINIATDFSTSSFAGVLTLGIGAGDIPLIGVQKGGAAGTFQIYSMNTAGTLTDPGGFNKWSWVGFGDQ